MTQAQVAEKAGLDFRHYQRIEGGKWPGLQLHTVEMLAAVFDLEVWELLSPGLRSGDEEHEEHGEHSGSQMHRQRLLE